jgi:hypothetical protein
MKNCNSVSLVTSCILFLCTDVVAVEILDQYHYQVPGQRHYGDYAIDAFQSLAQTITVEQAGTLSYIDLFISKTPGLRGYFEFSLRSTIAGAPNSSESLVEIPIDLNLIPDSTGFPGDPTPATKLDLREYGISIVPGQMLAIALERYASAAKPWLVWSTGEPPGGYAGGEIFERYYGGSEWIPKGYVAVDMEFATYVEIIPESSTFVLASAGAIAVLFFCAIRMMIDFNRRLRFGAALRRQPRLAPPRLSPLNLDSSLPPFSSRRRWSRSHRMHRRICHTAVTERNPNSRA